MHCPLHMRNLIYVSPSNLNQIGTLVGVGIGMQCVLGVRKVD